MLFTVIEEYRGIGKERGLGLPPDSDKKSLVNESRKCKTVRPLFVTRYNSPEVFII